jgi:hypothetical protein
VLVVVRIYSYAHSGRVESQVGGDWFILCSYLLECHEQWPAVILTLRMSDRADFLGGVNSLTNPIDHVCGSNWVEDCFVTRMDEFDADKDVSRVLSCAEFGY